MSPEYTIESMTLSCSRRRLGRGYPDLKALLSLRNSVSLQYRSRVSCIKQVFKAVHVPSLHSQQGELYQKAELEECMLSTMRFWSKTPGQIAVQAVEINLTVTRNRLLVGEKP